MNKSVDLEWKNESLERVDARSAAGNSFRIDRQLNGAINLYLQMEGLTPSPKLFKELMKAWRGFT